MLCQPDNRNLKVVQKHDIRHPLSECGKMLCYDNIRHPNVVLGRHSTFRIESCSITTFDIRYLNVLPARYSTSIRNLNVVPARHLIFVIWILCQQPSHIYMNWHVSQLSSVLRENLYFEETLTVNATFLINWGWKYDLITHTERQIRWGCLLILIKTSLSR